MAEEEKIFSLKESNSCMFLRVVARLLPSFNNNNLRYNSTYFRSCSYLVRPVSTVFYSLASYR